MESIEEPGAKWDEKIDKHSEAFWVFVEDVDSKHVLHHEFFLLKLKFATALHLLAILKVMYLLAVSKGLNPLAVIMAPEVDELLNLMYSRRRAADSFCNDIKSLWHKEK